jgi:hypothetical protein
MADLLPANPTDFDIIQYLKVRGVPNPRILRNSQAIAIVWDGGRITYSLSSADHGLASSQAAIPELHLYAVVAAAAPANISSVAHLKDKPNFTKVTNAGTTGRS